MMYRRHLLSWLIAMLVCIPATLAAQSYRINPGDILRIEVVEDETLNRSVLVAPDGRISFPLIGSIRAAGRTVDAVRGTLVANLTSNFAVAPSVFVALEERAPRIEPQEVEPEMVAIFVLGEVGQPGRVEMEPGATLLQAFSLMGGFSNFAATKRIQLRRTDPKTGIETVTTLNYNAISEGRTTNTTLRVQEGDVILVPTRRLFE